MFCEYRYVLKNALRLPQAIPVWASDFLFSFETDSEILVAVKLAVRCDATDMWPRIELAPREGVKAHFVFPDPRAGEVQDMFLTFLALLSLRGWDAQWDRMPASRRWIPETEIEAQAISANNFTLSSDRVHSPSDFPIPLNDLVQTVLASDSARALQQPLEFLQYATERYTAKRFIEAFQFYYFAMESLYCNGLSGTTKVVTQLMSITRLRVKMRMALKYPSLYVQRPEERTAYLSFVNGLTAREAFTKIVKTRGHLHHHNSRSPNTWSINGQESYWAIATLAANVAVPQLFWESWKHLSGETVKRQFEKIQKSLSR